MSLLGIIYSIKVFTWDLPLPEKLNGHAPETLNRVIPRDENNELFKSPTIDCATTLKYKYNLIKHLKSGRKVNKNEKGDN